MTDSPNPISRFPVPAVVDLPHDVRERIHEVEARAGFIPNVFLVLAHRPAEFRAFFDYYDVLMSEEGGLTKAEREMIVVATSARNRCTYCVVSHGALLRLFSGDPLLAEQVALNHREAPITERQKAMLDFALKVSGDSASLSEADFQVLRDAGLDDETIWEVGAIAAFFALSNRMANLTGMRPNPEFYGLGREPAAAPQG